MTGGNGATGMRSRREEATWQDGSLPLVMSSRRRFRRLPARPTTTGPTSCSIWTQASASACCWSPRMWTGWRLATTCGWPTSLGRNLGQVFPPQGPVPQPRRAETGSPIPSRVGTYSQCPPGATQDAGCASGRCNAMIEQEQVCGSAAAGLDPLCRGKAVRPAHQPFPALARHVAVEYTHGSRARRFPQVPISELVRKLSA